MTCALCGTRTEWGFCSVVSIRVDGTAEVSQALRSFPVVIKRRLELANRDAAIVVEKTWKEYLSGPSTSTRLGRKTGTLARSIRSVRRSTGGYVVGTSVKYARIHETGGKTPPMIIVPKRRKALRFMVRGAPVFARRVSHPGSKMPPRPHAAPTRTIATPAVVKIYAGHLEEARRLAGLGSDIAGERR